MGKTYFLDVDGTIVPHKTLEELDAATTNAECLDYPLPGVKELWGTFTPDDIIIITTARSERHRRFTEMFFQKYGLRYNLMLMDLPNGPRILINDTPYIFFQKAIAVNVMRNGGVNFNANCNHGFSIESEL